jgi:hypothetical protein
MYTSFIALLKQEVLHTYNTNKYDVQKFPSQHCRTTVCTIFFTTYVSLSLGAKDVTETRVSAMWGNFILVAGYKMVVSSNIIRHK